MYKRIWKKTDINNELKQPSSTQLRGEDIMIRGPEKIMAPEMAKGSKQPNKEKSRQLPSNLDIRASSLLVTYVDDIVITVHAI